MKLLYKPFALASGLLAARVGKKTFTAIWQGFTDAPKPTATDPEAGLAKITVSAALEAATMAATAAVFSQLSARLFHYMFGVWPGGAREATPEPE